MSCSARLRNRLVGLDDAHAIPQLASRMTTVVTGSSARLPSGVRQIGRGSGNTKKGTAGGRDGAYRYEDRRCVWVMVDAAPTLFFQTVEARNAHSDSPRTFGAAAWDPDEKPIIEAPVPKDFWVVAVQKHWEKWGTAVPLLHAQQDVAAASALLAAQQLTDDVLAAVEPR